MRAWRPRLGRPRLAGLARSVHLYLSIGALGLLLFFGGTGLILNHGQRLGLDEAWTTEKSLALPAEILIGPDRLMLVEKLRAALGEVGLLDSLEVDEQEARVVFKKPGLRVDAVARRSDGRTEVTMESRGLPGFIGDLHRGKDTGGWWWVMIDAAAGSLLLAAFSGATLWLLLPNRRWTGLAALLVGAAACVGGYWLLP